MDNADAWKQKYYESLEKLDRLEHKTKSWEELENLLRLAMNRVAVAAQGVDPVLDKHLRSLRNSVRSGDYPDLEAIIDNISSTVKRLDEQRQHNTDQTNTAPEILLSLLEQLQFPKSLKKRIKALRKSIKSLDKAEPVDAALQELAALVNETLGADLHPANNSNDKGILSRWFGGQDQSPDEEQPGEHPERHAVTNELNDNVPASSMQAHSTDPAQSLSTVPQHTENISVAAPQSKRYQAIQWGDSEHKVIANFCLRLLEALDFPEALDDRVQALRETVADGFNMVETGSVIQKIADLITATRVQVEKEKQELQDFLHHLTEHLQDIDRQLSGAESSHRAHQQNNKRLNEVVQEQVNIIETSVNEASELMQLKSNIQQRLFTIREQFEKHRQLEEQQQQELEQALAESNARLHDLEQESQQLRHRLTQEHQQAIHDTLTGVFNRLAYEERIEQEFARWKRYHQPLVLLIFDIDHFKRINDTYGHKAGDKALKLIAKTLQKNLRESDFLARFGGEEFIVLMPQTELSAAIGAANKLREAVQANQFHYQQKRVHITISCGASQFKDEDTIDSAFQRADQALYKAKQNGRNRCESS
ncbi:diguanylate cyclase [Kaarinaea lacus]